MPTYLFFIDIKIVLFFVVLYSVLHLEMSILLHQNISLLFQENQLNVYHKQQLMMQRWNKISISVTVGYEHKLSM